MLDQKVNLLIIEDTQTDADLLVHRLKKNDFDFEFDLVKTAGKTKERLANNRYDLVISDFNLPGFNGIEALRQVKEHDPMLPFILLSGSINKEQETQILQLGANEVIMKSNLNRLPFTVRRVLYEVADRKKLNETKQMLEKTVEQMEVLLKEVHHRVKNNLQVISSFLQLRQMNSKDEQVRKITADLLLKIQSIGTVHEKLYQSRDLANIDLSELVADLTSYTMGVVSDEKNQFNLECNVDPIQLNVNQAVPCGLIISELMYNSVQHAFEGRSDCNITVTISEKDNNIIVSVADNGSGLPESFSFEKASGLGSTIVATLFKQLKADYRIENSKGTEITFEFEKKRLKGSQSTIV